LQQLDVSSNVGVGKASAADLNGDGLADVVETLGSPFLSSSLVTRVLLGLPGGLFVEVQAWTGAQLCGLVDLDQDGILDVLNWGPPGDHLVSHLGTGAGFVQGPFTAIPDTGPGSVPVDFDGDGLPDVLIRENWLQGDFAILRGDGKGGFGPQHAVDFRVEHASNTFLFSDVVTDGRPDLVAIIEPQSIAALKVFPNLTYPAGGPLLDLGHAKPGPLGWPILLVSGDFTSGGEVDIHLFLGPPATPAVLVAGLSEALMPFHGGTLVPAPDFALGTLVTDAQGGADVLLHWPPGVPSGTQFTLQYWTVGPSPLASSASSAARLTVP
jgi:hypothetical protein